VFPEKFQLPLNPEVYFKGLRVESCRVMSSKKMPLWLSFQNATPNSPPFTVLYKAGDDLRQDQLTLQVLKVIDRLWKEAGLDLCMNVYGCVSTGFEQGMIEVVENSNTIGKITAGKASHFKKFQAFYNVYDHRVLKKWLRSKGHPAKVWEQNFLKSCAAYCVVTYVLGIGDRHNDNIMLKEDGQLFHIDFGHFLGNFKSKLGIKRERAPFIFTPAMAAVLGGTSGTLFKEFEKLCCTSYNILRKYSNLLITLFSLMLSCGIPELETEQDIAWLQEKLMIGVTDEVAAKTFVARIHEALNTRTTQFNDAVHLLKHA
jgi:phosphatidylinositol-4,5-bisphosphate 3-kinase